MGNVHNICGEERGGLWDFGKVWLRGLKDTGPLFRRVTGRRFPLLLPLLVVLLSVMKLLIPDVVLLAKLDLDELGVGRVFRDSLLEVWDLVAETGRHHVREEA